MDRRDFLRRAGLISAALTTAASRANGADERREGFQRVERQGHRTLSNGALAWELEWRDGRLRSSRWENKLSGNTFSLLPAEEFVLTFSAARQRIEIPWWHFKFGPDKIPVSPTEEQGFRRGYHRPETSDEGWGATDNLLLRNLRGVEETPDSISYDGYGWFRRWFELPKGAEGEEIVAVLGGYDFQDWNEYWVYLNGAEIGHRLSSGRWRSPAQFTVAPKSPHYTAVRFGPGKKNLLAVRTRRYDRRFGGLSDEVLRHYVFQPVLVDQFVTVGKPYLHLTDFELQGVKQANKTQAVFELRSASQPIRVFAHYGLDGPTRRKWLEITNEGSKEMLFLDLQIDALTVGKPTSEGGPGEPVLVNDEAFCAIEHPAGVNQGGDGQVRMLHFPARLLKPGDTTSSYTSLASVAKPGEALEHFISYIQERSPRKQKAIATYDPFGINNQWGGCPTLNDVEMLNGLDLLEKWQAQGVRFDYYVPDTGWLDHASDLRRFAPQCFPNGPAKIVERVKALGMKFGLWFATSWGAASCSDYPPVWASQVPAAGGPSEPGPPPQVYRNGYLSGGAPAATLCVASEPYFGILQNAILYHIRENSLKFFKLDGGSYYCNSIHHEHLPGKYSVEAMYDRLLEIAANARKAAPDIYVMWYWGVRSPFFALHGDSIFESGLYMEGSGTSWFPALYYRDSVILNLDQSTRFAKTVPPINKDSLGVWLADTRWGNFMGNRRWKEALVMDLGRGNLLFPQLWGDIYLLDDQDVRFLGEMVSLVKKNEALFLRRKNILGDPWKNEVYGYANFQGSRGFLFINNVHFASRKAAFNLGPEIGLEAAAGTRLQITSHFPERKHLARQDGSEFRAGDRVEIWIRPFEVLMLEIAPGEDSSETLPVRQVDSGEEAAFGVPLALQPIPHAGWLDMQFADAARFEKEGKRKKEFAFAGTLPPLEGDASILAIPIRLRRGKAEWRYSPAVVEIVQVVARIGKQKIWLIPVPDARQYGNTQHAGCSWVLYKVRLGPQHSHQQLQFSVQAYLPEDVEPQIEGWVVKQWWKESTRPLGDGYYAEEPS